MDFQRFWADTLCTKLRTDSGGGLWYLASGVAFAEKTPTEPADYSAVSGQYPVYQDAHGIGRAWYLASGVAFAEKTAKESAEGCDACSGRYHDVPGLGFEVWGLRFGV